MELLEGGVVPVCAPGEDENLEDMLDNHEFRLDKFVDGGLLAAFDEAAFSAELVLVNVGRCGMCGICAMDLGDAGGDSFA